MRANLNIAVSSYVGNGVDNRLINDMFAFKPDFVVIKGGSTNGYMKTKSMGMGSSVGIASAAAYETDAIKLLVDGGFVLGTNAGVNTNAATYYALAIGGRGSAKDYFKAIKYFGTGGDDRDLNALDFDATPDIFLEKGNTTQTGLLRTTSMSTESCAALGGSAMQTNAIQSLISGGGQLGTSARGNASNIEYNGFLARALSGVFTYGTFRGTGAAQTISTEFALDWIIIKNYDNTRPPVMKLSSMPATTAGPLSNIALNSTMVTAFGANGGFTVDTSDYVNGSSHNIYWIGGRAGNFIVPPTRVAV